MYAISIITFRSILKNLSIFLLIRNVNFFKSRTYTVEKQFYQVSTEITLYSFIAITYQRNRRFVTYVRFTIGFKEIQFETTLHVASCHRAFQHWGEKMIEPLVTIIIPAYNVKKYIGQCLSSVQTQTYQNWMATIVLSPSNDNTKQEIQKYLVDPRFHLIEEKEKGTCSIARNTGFENNDAGKYVCFFDADDWMEPTKIRRQIDLMESDPYLAWCGHPFFVNTPDGKEVIENKYPGKDPEPAGTTSIMFRRETLEKVKETDGYIFNPKIMRCDDFDLVLRVRREVSGFIPEPLSHWRIVENGLTNTATRWQQFYIITGIALRHLAWNTVANQIKIFGIYFIHNVLHCYPTYWKKRLFG